MWLAEHSSDSYSDVLSRTECRITKSERENVEAEFSRGSPEGSNAE